VINQKFISVPKVKTCHSCKKQSGGLLCDKEFAEEDICISCKITEIHQVLDPLTQEPRNEMEFWEWMDLVAKAVSQQRADIAELRRELKAIRTGGII
jgi:hypothetical protein